MKSIKINLLATNESTGAKSWTIDLSPLFIAGNLLKTKMEDKPKIFHGLSLNLSIIGKMAGKTPCINLLF